MDWKWADPLREGMVSMPFVDISEVELPAGVAARVPTEDDLGRVFPKAAHSLKTWGRTPGILVDDPHWIGVSGSTPLHFDPKYPRYTHHLLLVIDSDFVLRGYDKEEVGLKQGTYFCMDGHSPHQLHAKKRGARWYLAVSIDSHEQMPRDEMVEQLVEYAATAPFFAPDLEVSDV